MIQGGNFKRSNSIGSTNEIYDINKKARFSKDTEKRKKTVVVQSGSGSASNKLETINLNQMTQKERFSQFMEKNVKLSREIQQLD